MSEEQPIVPEVVEKKVPKIQYVTIVLADGRRGIFAGPEFLSNAELTLVPPRLVSIDFSAPRDYPQQAFQNPESQKEQVAVPTEEAKPSGTDTARVEEKA